MKKDFNKKPFLTSAYSWEALFLTFIFAFFPWQILYAATDDGVLDPTIVAAASPANSLLDQMEGDQRRGLLFKYVRQEVPSWAPGLNEKLRAPLTWATSKLRAIGGVFGAHDDGDEASGDEGFLPPLIRPLSALMQVPNENEAQAFWIAPDYHHKGFLPFHDAMITEMNFRERAFDDRVQFDLRPFYGQNWVSLNGYGGAELGVGLTHKGDTQPWGRIGFCFINGASDLMDNNRGFDMNAELRFNEHLALTAGIHGTENSDLGNYVLLRWKVIGFGN